MCAGCFRKGHLAPVCLRCVFSCMFLCRYALIIQGRVWLRACGLEWVGQAQAGCVQPLPLLTLFQARLKIAGLPLPTETEVLPWAFTPPRFTLLGLGGQPRREASPIAPASYRSPVFILWSWDRGAAQKSCFHCLLSPQTQLGWVFLLLCPHTTNLLASSFGFQTLFSPI